APCAPVSGVIQGQMLQQAIERFHEADVDGTLDEPGLVPWRLLNRFVGVCNTIACAHNKGITHGNIRPDNVVLGPYGETQVLGWGLAEAPVSENGSAAAPAGGQPKGVIRTPIYMSPEQAEGRGDVLGPRSDVYNLGATLYTLLTGKHPFPGNEIAEALENIKQGEFLSPREQNDQVPRGLEKIVLKTMARQPEKRYATVSEMVADLE